MKEVRSKSIKRVRTGCWNCKQRRRRCTEEKPQCQLCKKRNLDCQYVSLLSWSSHIVEILATDDSSWTQFPKQPANWTVSSSFLGICEKQPHKFRHATTTNHYFVNTSVNDMSAMTESRLGLGEILGTRTVHQDIRPSERTSSIPRSPLIHDFVLDSHHASDIPLIDFYVHKFCRSKTLIDSPDNNFRRLVLPVMANSTALRYAVLTLAAFHYPQGNIHYMHQLALSFKHKSLKLMQSHVQKLLCSGTGSLRGYYESEIDGVLLAMVLLCVSDITTGSTKEWVTHLRGALYLIKMIENVTFKSTTLQFAKRYFLARYALSCTAIDTDSYFQEKITAMAVPQLSSNSHLARTFESTEVNEYIGCSEETLTVISLITAFAREKYRIRQTGATSLAQEEVFLSTATDLSCRLEKIAETFSYENETIVIDEFEQHRLPYYLQRFSQIFLYSDLFKRATYLYLRHAGFDIPITHPSIQQELLPELLSLFDKVNTEERSVYPMWPLFIASSMAVTEEHRRIALDQFERLRKIWKISNVGNVGVTEEAVQSIWKWYDMTEGSENSPNLAMSRSFRDLELDIPAKSISSRCSTKTRLDLQWDEPLRRLGWRMSLT